MAQWITDILQSPLRVAMPIMTHPGIELTGKRVVDAVTDGQTHFEAIKAVVQTYGMAACTVIMDLTVEAEAFGAPVDFPDDEVPHVTGRLVSGADDVSRLQVPSLTAGRVPEFLKANRLAAAYFTDRPVFAGCIGPFSLAGRLYDMSEIMVAIYIEPDVIQALLEKCTQFLLAYCRALKETGATGVIMAEPAAGLLSDDDCRTFSTEYVRRIVDAVQDESFSVVLHNCGNQGQCTQAMIDTGAAALHFGNAIDIRSALETCPADVPVMGNLDPVGILKQATPEDVYRRTAELLEATRGYANFVLSTGCDVPPQVPAENIRSFYRALEAYNRTLSPA